MALDTGARAANPSASLFASAERLCCFAEAIKSMAYLGFDGHYCAVSNLTLRAYDLNSG